MRRVHLLRRSIWRPRGRRGWWVGRLSMSMSELYLRTPQAARDDLLVELADLVQTPAEVRALGNALDGAAQMEGDPLVCVLALRRLVAQPGLDCLDPDVIEPLLAWGDKVIRSFPFRGFEGTIAPEEAVWRHQRVGARTYSVAEVEGVLLHKVCGGGGAG